MYQVRSSARLRKTCAVTMDFSPFFPGFIRLIAVFWMPAACGACSQFSHRQNPLISTPIPKSGRSTRPTLWPAVIMEMISLRRDIVLRE